MSNVFAKSDRPSVPDDTPVNGVVDEGISSNWAYDHENDADVHPEYIKEAEFTANGEVLVGTGAGTFQAESGAPLRTSVGCDPTGTDNSTDVTLDASATTGGLSIIDQDISNRAATNAQTGYATAAHILAIETNTGKETNVSTNLSEGASTETTVKVASSDGTDATLVSASALRAGLLTKAKFDEIVANTLKDTNVSTDLSIGTKTATTVDINSSDGNNATIPAATTSEAGLLTDAQFDKLDGIEAAADVTSTHETSHANVLVDGEFASAGLMKTDGSAGYSIVTDTLHTQNTDTALGAQSEDLDMNTHKIVDVTDPTTNQEAATKAYTDLESTIWGTL